MNTQSTIDDILQRVEEERVDPSWLVTALLAWIGEAQAREFHKRYFVQEFDLLDD